MIVFYISNTSIALVPDSVFIVSTMITWMFFNINYWIEIFQMSLRSFQKNWEKNFYGIITRNDRKMNQNQPDRSDDVSAPPETAISQSQQIRVHYRYWMMNWKFTCNIQITDSYTYLLIWYIAPYYPSESIMFVPYFVKKLTKYHSADIG